MGELRCLGFGFEIIKTGEVIRGADTPAREISRLCVFMDDARKLEKRILDGRFVV